MNNFPLVSIPVVTYNSSSYILDGLESVKTQTYNNIELVISDDCSTDITVDICKKWIENNKQYFKRVVLVTSVKNTGVAGNLNRALRECRGEWIKTLSGDDKFLPYTISGYVDYVISHPEVNICYAPFEYFGKDIEYVNKTSLSYESLNSDIKSDLKHQQKLILKKMFIPGPGIFYKKELWEKIGGYDENYPFAEEYPFFDRVILSGNRVFFVPQRLYSYQIDKNSLGRTGGKGVQRHLRDRYKYFTEKRKYILFKKGKYLLALYQYVSLKQMIAKCERSKTTQILLFLPCKVFSLLNKLNLL